MIDLPPSDDDRVLAETRLHLGILKRAVRDAPQSEQARLALAAAYRELAPPDQAGRWGALTEGWSTEIETDRFARLLGASEIGPAEIRSFLLLPSAATVPESILALIAGPAADYQREFGPRSRAPGFASTSTESVAAHVFWFLAGGALISSLITVLVVYFAAIAEQPWATLIARVGGVIATAFAFSALVAWLGSRALGRRSARALER